MQHVNIKKEISNQNLIVIGLLFTIKNHKSYIITLINLHKTAIRVDLFVGGQLRVFLERCITS